MRRLSDQDIKQYLKRARVNNERALSIDKYLREVSADEFGYYPNSLTVWHHHLLIYCSSFILSAENTGLDMDGACEFPFLPGEYWVDYPEPILFAEKSFLPFVAFDLSNLSFVEYTASANISALHKLQGYAVQFFLTATSAIRKKNVAKEQMKLLDNALQTLKRVLEVIADDLGLTTQRGVFIDNFLRYVKSYGQFYEPPKAAKLVSGVLISPVASIRALMYRNEEKPVDGYDHGEMSAIWHDEPFVNVGELNHASTFFTYGNVERLGNILQNRLTVESKVRLQRIAGSEGYRVKGRSDTKKKVCELESPTMIYLPTSFSGHCRYLPYRDYSDEVYYTWQAKLVESLKLYGFDVSVKQHPKSKVVYPDPNAVNVTHPVNTTTLAHYDIVVLDYVSTAFATALRSDCELWYYDIGLRNLDSALASQMKGSGSLRLEEDEAFEDFIARQTETYLRQQGILAEIY